MKSATKRESSTLPDSKYSVSSRQCQLGLTLFDIYSFAAIRISHSCIKKYITGRLQRFIRKHMILHKCDEEPLDGYLGIKVKNGTMFTRMDVESVPRAFRPDSQEYKT